MRGHLHSLIDQYRNLPKRRGLLMLAVASGFTGISIAPALATIDNTVTVTATPRGGVPNSIVVTASETLDVEDAAPELTIVKTAVLNDEINADGFAEVGETTTYTYEVSNSGNVTLTNIAVQDTHEGVILSPAPAGETITVPGPNLTSDIGTPNDGVVQTLDVGATATFTINLTVTQQEVDDQ